MPQHGDLPQRGAGGGAGKLLKDPEAWYPVNAIIDGLDPWSENPTEKLKFAVYQQRMSHEILQTQVIAQAILSGPDQAQKAMQNYLDSAVPLSESVQRRRERAKERLLKEIENMAPIPISQVSLGKPVGGQQVATSMFRRDK